MRIAVPRSSLVSATEFVADSTGQRLAVLPWKRPALHRGSRLESNYLVRRSDPATPLVDNRNGTHREKRGFAIGVNQDRKATAALLATTATSTTYRGLRWIWLVDLVRRVNDSYGQQLRTRRVRIGWL